MVGPLVRFLQAILFGISAAFRKAMCFLNRKQRRLSGDRVASEGPIDIRTEIPAGSAESIQFPTHQAPVIMQATADAEDEEEADTSVAGDWDAWGSSQLRQSEPVRQAATVPVSAKPAAQGSGRGRKESENKEPEPDVDFFQDMVPRLKKPAQVLIKPAEQLHQTSGQGLSARLNFSAVDVPAVGSNLGTWDDAPGSSTAGWGEAEDDLTVEAEAALKEKRREQREARKAENYQKKLEKENAKALQGGRHGKVLAATKMH